MAITFLTNEDKQELLRLIEENGGNAVTVDDAFYAIYGTTTNAEIEEAYQAGKKLYCLNGDGICPLYQRYTPSMVCFYRGGFYIYCNNDEWMEDCPYELSTNKTTEITKESTDVQYPSAKAVFDALADSKIDVTAEVGQTLRVKTVDENGKPTEWEAADYPLIPYEMIPHTTYTPEYDSSLGCFVWNFYTGSKPIVGATYIVWFDGVEYTCTVKSAVFNGVDAVYIGNGVMVGDNTGEPFCFAVVDGLVGDGYIAILNFDGNEHTVSLISDDMKLADKYLPTQPLSHGSARGSAKTVGAREEDSEYTMGQYAFAEGCDTTASGNFSHSEGQSTTASGYTSHAEGWATTASGNYSHAEGENTTASGHDSHSEGENTTASGHDSHSEGGWSIASGDYSHAEGYETTASGYYSHAEGYITTASGSNSHAEGYNTITSGTGSHAEGSGGTYTTITVTGDANTKVYTLSTSPEKSFVGKIVRYTNPDSSQTTFAKINSINTTDNTITLDKILSTEALTNITVNIYAGIAYGSYSHAEGSITIASGYASHSEGSNTAASGENSHAEGSWTKASGGHSHAEGGSTTASGYYSHAEGSITIASGESSHAEGSGTIASGIYSHAEGQNTTASGATSHAEGCGTTASGNNSHAEGYDTTASGDYSHAEGQKAIASGYNSHAEGGSTTASGYYSHAEGGLAAAIGYYSHAEGNSTTAIGYYSHAEGNSTIASGYKSHAEGQSRIASGDNSHAEGGGGALTTIIVTGDGNTNVYTLSKSPEKSFVGKMALYGSSDGSQITVAKIESINISDNTITLDRTLSTEALTNIPVVICTGAFGENSHAEGWHTTASGSESHAEGHNTTASGDYSHTQGKYNIADTNNKYAHIVGNGDDDDNRSNAHTLDWDGNAWFAGDVYVNGTGQDDTNAVKLAKMSDIPNVTAELGQTLRVKAIDENGKPTEWEAADYQEKICGAGFVELVPATTLTYDAGSNIFTLDSNLLKLVGGKTYQVNYNGVDYESECVGYAGQPYVRLGNVDKLTGTGDNGVPFGITSVPGYFVQLCSYDEAESVTLSISEQTIQKISDEYLPSYPIVSGTAEFSARMLSAKSEDENYTMGAAAFAEGSDTKASGNYSHSEGDSTTASAEYSHAEGRSTTASGRCSHAEGQLTKASGNYSHSEGDSTTASGYASHAEGQSTTASGIYSHVQGKYNIADTANKYAHIVGNGDDDDKRSNAHTLDWNGNAWFAGDVYVKGTGQDDTNAVKLAKMSDIPNVTAQVGQTIVVKEVDENGKPTAWESAEYQPRTHWAEFVELLPNTPAIVSDGMALIQGVDFQFAAGATYTINWNGTPYACVAVDMNGVCVGNVALSSGTGDTGEPFCMTVADGMLYAFLFDGSTEVTIGVSGYSYQKIDKNYLPEDTVYGDPVYAKPMFDLVLWFSQECQEDFITLVTNHVVGGEDIWVNIANTTNEHWQKLRAVFWKYQLLLLNGASYDTTRGSDDGERLHAFTRSLVITGGTAGDFLAVEVKRLRFRWSDTDNCIQRSCIILSRTKASATTEGN